MAIEWLEENDVRLAHRFVMLAAGDQPQPVNPERLAGAIARPRNLNAYGGIEDIVALAETLAVAVSQAQAFLDGNKRTGYQAMAVFLAKIGLRSAADGLEIARWLEGIAEEPEAQREAMIELFADWLRQRCHPR